MTFFTIHWSQFNQLRTKQNGQHFADSNFKCGFFKENNDVLMQISLKLISNAPTKYKPALVQTGDKSLSEPMMT